MRASRGANTLFLFALAGVLGALAGAARKRFTPHLLALGALIVTLGVGVIPFRAGTVYDLFVPLVAVGLVWSGTTALRLLTEGKRNKWLEATFGCYLAPPIIESLKKDPTLLALGGRKREVTGEAGVMPGTGAKWVGWPPSYSRGSRKLRSPSGMSTASSVFRLK